MSGRHLIVVFLLGLLFSLLAILLSNYLHLNLKWTKTDGDPGIRRPTTNGAFRQALSIFLLPDTSQLHVLDDAADPLNVGLYITKKKVEDATENSSLEAEALSSLYAAIDMRRVGKHDKAHKLFEHAMALCPKHPDILNHYGEFLEETRQDILTADQYYMRALAYSPSHHKALENRMRTLPVVEEMDEMLMRRIDEKRDLLVNIPDSNAALRRVKKEAYFQHIYHTVGIEGNTMSLAQTRSIVETRMAVGGKSVFEHSEILGLDSALKYINTTLVSKVGAVSVDDILQIHKRVLGFVDPLEAGSFRRTQVYVGDHVPPPPSEINVLMEDYVQWLNSERALRLHPVKYAALAHYRLAFIHPFTDGNGRTSRLLMNLILMQAGYPPVIIRKQERQQYYEFLEFGNEGDVRPFVRFIADCTERTLDVYLWATTEYGKELPALSEDKKEKIIVLDESLGLN